VARTEEIKNGAPLNNAERELWFWQYRRAGSFITNLFLTIGKADIGNKYKLSLGFPDEVEAYDNYTKTEGYWEALEERMK